MGYSLFSLQERGRLSCRPATSCTKACWSVSTAAKRPGRQPDQGKKLTNVRSAGKDENIPLTPPVKLTLEYAVEFIEDDELVEVTPKSIRLRKRFWSSTSARRLPHGAPRQQLWLADPTRRPAF